ncbi:MAG: SDR family oxidoreductase [Oscillospiraceae bacterium]|jgi:NAD(P)-dependent dehydrogenase (short-subunit alcohol dehydrogenase family)|nr:SDR family oxidoreductase [Oscillospiraceae bacterium]
MDILVTGAARGLGYVLCNLLASEGHRVFAGIRPQSANAEIKALAEKYSDLILLDMDVTDENQVAECAKNVAGTCGKLDAVVSNAGVLCDSDRTLPILETNLDDLRTALEVNVVGSAAVIKHFHKLVKPDGIFITITSEAGSMQNPGTVYSAYGISKSAQNKLVLIFKSNKPGFRVYAMHPGRMNTDMGRKTAQIEPIEAARGIAGILSGAITVPEENGWYIDYMGNAMPV